MQENYILKYQNNDKYLAKSVCLGFCILLDFIVLTGVIACLSVKKYVDLLIYLAIFVVATAIRIATLFMTFEVIVEFAGGEVSITKKYAIKKKRLYKGQIADLKIEKCNDLGKTCNKKCARLCSKSCESGVYMVELLQRKYLIYLDDYSYSLIEVKSDLS